MILTIIKLSASTTFICIGVNRYSKQVIPPLNSVESANEAERIKNENKKIGTALICIGLLGIVSTIFNF